MFWYVLKVVATVAFGMGLDKGDVGAVSIRQTRRILGTYVHLFPSRVTINMLLKFLILL